MNIYEEYINSGGSIAQVPQKYITQEMCNTYYKYYGYGNRYNVLNPIKNIPEEYVTQDMVDHTWEKYHAIAFIPKKYQTQEMANYEWKKSKNIKKIPDKYKTQEIVDEYLKDGGTIINIPFRFVTQELIDKEEKIIKDKGPVELYSLFNGYSKKQFLLRVLLLNNKTDITREKIAKKYNISIGSVDTVLKSIKEIDENKYNEIKQIFSNNSDKYINSSLTYASRIVEIIKSLGPIKNKMSKEQKIQFSYLLGTANIKYNLYEIYSFLGHLNDLSPEYKSFIDFCRHHLGYKYFNQEKITMLDEEEHIKVHGRTWMSNFNKEFYFKDRNNRPIEHAYLDKNGEKVVIKEDDVKLLLKYLEKEHIPTRNCIVKEALSRYINGELEIFCDELKSGEYLEKKNEETIKVKTK